MNHQNLANLTTQYQSAYLVYCYKIMQYLQALAWLAGQKAPQNQAITTKVKPKSASGVKKLAQDQTREKPTLKSLKYQEKPDVSMIVAMGFPNGAMSAAFRVAFSEAASSKSSNQETTEINSGGQYPLEDGMHTTMVCRPTSGVFSHCGTFVWEGKDPSIGKIIAQYSLEGFTNEFLPQTTNPDQNFTFRTDLAAFRKPGGRNKHYTITPPSGMSSVDFANEVVTQGINYIASTYKLFAGPNSNSAAAGILYRSGARVPKVRNAPALHYWQL